MKIKIRKSKIAYSVVFALFFLWIMTGCKSQVSDMVEKEKIVKVRTIEAVKYPIIIKYYGQLEPEEIKNYAFKSGGKLEQVNVEVGDVVSKGALLATLDSFEVDLGLDASIEQLKMAKLDAEKAQETFNFYSDTYEDMLSLYSAGAVALNQLNEAELQKEIKSKDLEQAQKKKQQAEIDLGYKSKTVEDTGLISEIEGYVAEIHYKVGELVPQGYPTITVRSLSQIAKISVTLEDIKKIELGDKTQVKIDANSYEGQIAHIDLIPNQATRTYGVEVKMDTSESFILGQDCHVEIEDESQEGLWLNINEIMNDGADYVYVVKDSRAFRKTIETHEIYKDKVRVTGLESGDQVIVEGKNALIEGYKVIVEGESNE
ncbi:efflux RND transporter periplasmic adaptor subunit [Fusibacter sp. 3D3]|uniref:efflux RND transporter periplasmic adaptor subunit n=1 Tax=Fusibacter sp. 3D3 TaxID=1048380 RepID=UPI00085307C2|nr:efflux RND transporter periplasmic adaptor subunit [Fusibacter sp. 3D3]GAU79769.1 probable Co/Zn/Cd efflux system membrane fusion protein [Fusibacter sp. 3D3]